MQYFPLFFDLNRKSVLVVGGGEVATRKVDMLMRAGAIVTLISPKIDAQLHSWVKAKQVHWIQNFYSADLLSKDFVQLWATTNNPAINHQIYQDAKDMGILVNVVDDLPYCDFITPSVVNRGRIQIAISSGGASPVLVRNIRQTLESVLAHNTALLGDFAASKRNDIKEHFATVTERKSFWESFFALTSVAEATSWEQLESVYVQKIKGKHVETPTLSWIEVGQDVELLTFKALQQMQKAETVLYFKDCPFEFVDLVRRDASREVYKDTMELVALLENKQENDESICVLIPADSSEFNLLMGHGKCYKLGMVQ
ncbi:siroheme synthase [Vibrio sp. S4M6]|uniref:precorrin-2 dehydrogenase/sirohydrochlorin ferrochelatase family protein n=1 Tax=Vibrio sinus TaxID=2946865 RepID=UPI00202AA658|nr:siroheme synthase [Vibrio sinus]MCL9783129.1 siroheme synthase [Vibrio sinus]